MESCDFNLTPPTPSRVPSKLVEEAWELYLELVAKPGGMDTSRMKLTDTRKKLLRDRIKKYGFERVIAKINGYALDDWMMGRKEGADGWFELENVMRHKHWDKHCDLAAGAAPKQAPLTAQQPQHNTKSGKPPGPFLLTQHEREEEVPKLTEL